MLVDDPPASIEHDLRMLKRHNLILPPVNQVTRALNLLDVLQIVKPISHKLTGDPSCNVPHGATDAGEGGD